MSNQVLGASPVVVTGTRPNRLALAERLGADAVVDVREQDPVEAVLRLTGGRGADLVIESSGGSGAPEQCVQMAKRGGRILLLAFYQGPVTFDLSVCVRNDITLFATRGEGGAAVGRAVSLLAQGKIRGAELVTHRYRLDQIREGFRVLKERESNPVSVVLIP